MAIDPEILAAVVKSRKAGTAKRQAEISERKQALCESVPEIAAIQSELIGTMTELSRAVFGNSGDAEQAVDQIRRKNQELQERRRQALVRAGYPADYLSDAPLCSKCGDSLYIGSEPCECVTRECVRLQNSELCPLLNLDRNNFSSFNPDYYSDKPDQNYMMSPRENMEYIYGRCMDFVKEFGSSGKNLLFRGSSGLGKTFLAGCIAREVSARGFSVVYDSASGIFGCMEQDKFGNAGEQTERRLHRLSACDLLIIDDLGSEMQTSFTVSAFYSLINLRLLSGLSTIVITTLDEAGIRRRYGGQNASRLLGDFYQLNFFGDDIRIIKNQGSSAW